MLIQWKKYWEDDVEFTINEESDYYEENTSGNEDFFSTIFQPFQLDSEQKKRVVIRAMRKKQNISTLQLPIYYILE